MKVAILGFGAEGKSILRFLKKYPAFKGAAVSVLDKKLDKNYLRRLEQYDIVFRSPGVFYNLPEIQRTVKKGVIFSSATKLFFDNFKGRFIGITGTKGKSTTSTLLYKILEACGKKVYLAGNIGKPAIEILPKLNKNSIAILELSSFQLQDLKKSPTIAVVLETFPDHMDAHKNLKEYFDSKTNISKYQNKNDKIFYAADSKYAKLIAQKSKGKKIGVSAKNFRLFKPEILKIPGPHNFKNAAMAASVALSLGCPKNKILKTVKNFKGNEHRLELVRSIRINQPNRHKSVFIKFYNDSASTNPQTAAAAVKSFKAPSILIAGGKDKGLNYSPLKKALKESNVRLVVLFGENKGKIKRQIVNSKAQIVMAKDLKSAVNLAYKFAKSLVAKPHTLNPTVIFSPAAASFDMFKNYKDRGEKFKEIVRKI
jgi:UDP-N-acetylmuramoylalanine--D-glutamate ligase